MKVLLTGCNGFIGTEFSEYFKNSNYEIYSMSRRTLDVSVAKQVDDFFNNNVIDVVVHAAVEGGARETPSTLDDLISNLAMFSNLRKHSDKYKMMINLCSGAAFDRRKNISRFKEEEIEFCYPEDYYGLSKNVIAKEICYEESNLVNFRLFGCFGAREKNTRLIKNCINNLMNNDPMIIHQDREMDFFYVKDLFVVMKYYIENFNNLLPKDVNMSYQQKMSLFDIVDFLKKTLNKEKVGTIMQSPVRGLSYSGSGERLKALRLNLVGLEAGIVEVCEELGIA